MPHPLEAVANRIRTTQVLLNFSLLVALTAGTAGLPGRTEEILIFGKDGYAPWEYFFSSFFRDINVNLAFLIPPLVFVWLLHRVLAFFGLRECRRRVFLLLVIPVALISIFHFFGSEFRVERGVYPSWFDLGNAKGGIGVGLAYLQLAFKKEILPVWGIVFFSVYLTTQYWHQHITTLKKWSTFPLVALLLAGISDVSHKFWVTITPRLPTILTARTTESPLSAFLRKKVGRNTMNGFFGVYSLLEGIESRHLTSTRSGFALLGLDPQSADRMNLCGADQNPLRQSFEPPVSISKDVEPLTVHLDKLSKALFENQDAPIKLVQVLVETFPASDFSSLGGKLPERILPFWNSVIKNGLSGHGSVIVGSDMRQAGVRTSQAISASYCGLGTLPHLLSIGRDLQAIPLRCLPEILTDAGFISEMHHGYRPEFDSRTRFFEARKMDFWHIRRIPGSIERLTAFWDGDIGLSDRKLVEFSLNRSQSLSSLHHQFINLLTLSSHRPFIVPQDIDMEDKRVAESVVSELPEAIRHSKIVRDRIQILKYVDTQLRNLVEGLNKQIKMEKRRPIVIVAMYGDHSHGDADLFAGIQPRSASEQLASLSRIPFTLQVLEESLVNHPKKSKIIKEMARITEILKDQVISQNDIPRMLLRLLKHSEPIRGLPLSQKWHTLGGQVLSPFSKPPLGFPTGEVWGVNGRSVAFVVSKDGSPLIEEQQSTLDTGSAALKPGVLQPITQAIALLLKSNTAECHK